MSRGNEEAEILDVVAVPMSLFPSAVDCLGKENNETCHPLSLLKKSTMSVKHSYRITFTEVDAAEDRHQPFWWGNVVLPIVV